MRPPEPDPIKNVKAVKIKEETNNNVLLEGAELESVEDYIEKVIHIRTKKVGYLIGTAGRTIRGFENNSGAKIDIMSPNSTDQETPILLSGTAESVRNVLRMIMDLYHMNNFSSQLWQHLRNNEHKDNKDNDLLIDEQNINPMNIDISLQFFSKNASQLDDYCQDKHWN